jgi:hypothetical protein
MSTGFLPCHHRHHVLNFAPEKRRIVMLFIFMAGVTVTVFPRFFCAMSQVLSFEFCRIEEIDL